MDLFADRLDESEIGPQLAEGRDTTIFALGDDKVVRRAPDPRSYVAEAQVMEQVREAGYPVPRVHRVGPGEMVLDRVAGPTMLADLSRRPWKLGSHARLLAELHARLHALTAPESLRAGPVEGATVLHLDLHPDNVILSPAGPVVIDWTNAARGAGAADVALTWILLATAEVDGPAPVRAVTALLRRRYLNSFLAAAGRDAARRVLPAVAAYRLGDRNNRPSEAAAIERLVASEA